MSKLFYRLGIFFYTLGIRLAAPFSQKAKLWTKGRKNSFKDLKTAFDQEKASVIWIHCASLGEFEQGRPLIEALRAQYPNYKILLTFFSPSGYEIRKNYALADWVFYLPSDSPSHAAQFIAITQPKIAVFVKYEFWYYYLTELQRQQIPTYLISAIFRPQQIFFKWYGGLFREMLSCFESIFVQDEASINLLASVDYNKAILAGDTRLDRVLSIKSTAQKFAAIDAFCDGSKVLVAGSTWLPDEQILADFLKSNPHYKIILAPHQIEATHLQQIERLFDFTICLRYSQQAANFKNASVLIIDNIGMLSSLYAYGQIAYIGGGFGAGIHNTLEAVVYEIPVLFGSNYHKFKEAQDFIQLEVAFEIKTAEDVSKISLAMQDAHVATRIAEKITAYISANKGATTCILKGMDIS